MNPGDLVVPNRRVRKDGNGELTVWKTIYEEKVDMVDIVQMGEFLLVLEVHDPQFRYPNIGWEKCLRVLTCRGNVGWVGKGWVDKVTTDI